MAIAILAIISIVLFGMVNQVGASWGRVQSQIDIHQNARSILSVMASELRLAALPVDRSNPNGLQFIVDPSQLIGAASSISAGGFLNAHAIFWQAPIATSTTQGNLAEVGYFVRWDTSVAGNPRASLCRFFVNPDDANSHYLIYSNPTAWLSGAILDAVAPANGPSYQGWMADNVIGLWVRCLDANGNPITRVAAVSSTKAATLNYSFDSRRGFTALDASRNPLEKSGYSDATLSPAEQVLCTLPNTVEIAIVVIDSQTARAVASVPSYPQPYQTSPQAGYPSPVSPYTKYSPVNFWNDINNFLTTLKAAQPRVARGAHVFSMRVPLANGG